MRLGSKHWTYCLSAPSLNHLCPPSHSLHLRSLTQYLHLCSLTQYLHLRSLTQYLHLCSFTQHLHLRSLTRPPLSPLSLFTPNHPATADDHTYHHTHPLEKFLLRLIFTPTHPIHLLRWFLLRPQCSKAHSSKHWKPLKFPYLSRWRRWAGELGGQE